MSLLESLQRGQLRPDPGTNEHERNGELAAQLDVLALDPVEPRGEPGEFLAELGDTGRRRTLTTARSRHPDQA